MSLCHEIFEFLHKIIHVVEDEDKRNGGRIPFESDIFTFNGSKIRKVLLVITLSQFPMSFAIIALEYVRFSWGLLLAAEIAVFFFNF